MFVRRVVVDAPCRTGASDPHGQSVASSGPTRAARRATTTSGTSGTTIEQLLARRKKQTKQLLSHATPLTVDVVATPPRRPVVAAPVLSVPTLCEELVCDCVEPAAIAIALMRHPSSNGPHWPAHAPFVLPTTSAVAVQHTHTLAAEQQQWQQRWKELVVHQLPRHHAYQSTRSNLQQQQRTKLSATIAREYVRLLHRQYRCIRDSSVRGRRLVREVTSYWRRAEKDAYENRKRHEREELENRRRATEQKEAERQKKKLEFLLTQTELYSHFIGRKMNVMDAKEATNATTPAAGATTDGAAAAAASSSAAEPVAAAAATGAANGATTASGDAPGTIPASLLQHASEVRNDANVSADEAARAYIANQRAKMQEFDQLESRAQANAGTAGGAADGADADGASPDATLGDVVDDSLDLLNPSTMPQQDSFVQAAKNFNGTLKSYQLRGLNWLLNLYEQGINGILADEMGLGKTVQSISFLSYLAGSKDIWGPFLIVAPNSTLHQWQQEVTKFSPDLKVLPYWGSAKERQILRQFWTSKQMYTKQAPFHVLITSYNVVVADEKYFHRMRFMYMVLDEAQAIKNAASLRWKCLLNLKCRNRVLLTGTPIQNSMAELWALLHFIMPEFFDNHEEFAEWFSKDVEDAATEGVGLDQRQVQRLHMILKPFMLRRVKKDVENEMPPKIEVTLPCKLSAAQLRIYKTLQKKILFATEQSNLTAAAAAANKKTFLAGLAGPSTFTSSDPTATDSLVTLVMQFRKVCNHPELYERKHVVSPFYFGQAIYYPATKQKTNNSAAGPAPGTADETAVNAPAAVHSLLLLRCPAALISASPVAPRLPSLLHRAIRVPSRDKLLEHTFDVFAAHRTVASLYSDAPSHKVAPFSTFSFLPFLDLTPGELEFACGAEPLHAWFMTIVLAHRRVNAALMHDKPNARVNLIMPPTGVEMISDSLRLSDISAPSLEPRRRLEPRVFATALGLGGSGLVWRDPAAFDEATTLLRRLCRASRPRVLAATPFPQWSHSIASPAARIDAFAPEYAGWEKSVLLGTPAWQWSHHALVRNRHGQTYPVSLARSLDLLPVGLATMHRRTYAASPFTEAQALAQLAANRAVAGSAAPTPPLPPLFVDPTAPLHLQERVLHASSVVASRPVPGLLSSVSRLGLPASRLLVPTVEDLITDSGKLQVLDALLTQLKRDGHRVLIFSQMTKLIDLLENFLAYRRYKYSRLDGQTSLSLRRDRVRRFQQDTSVFAFLLSTRAGGLGINLTAADTVIFYDNDWNPSSDAQAMDRVHRIGQTRQVTVYRLVCVNTVEERILIRAQQKHVIQNTVYAGGFKMTAASHDSKTELQELFSGSELQQLLEVEPATTAGDDAAAIIQGATNEAINASANANASPAPAPAPNATNAASDIPAAASMTNATTATVATVAAPVTAATPPLSGMKHPLDTTAEEQALKRQKSSSDL